MNRVLQVVGSNVVIKTMVRKSRYQLWYYDGRTKTIINRATNKSLDARGNNLTVQTTIGSNIQRFRFSSKFIYNVSGKVIDVTGNRDSENVNVRVWKRIGGLNQQWKIIYADSLPADPTKGQLSTQFGLYVERNFHIISGLGSRRYLDRSGRNLVIKTKNKSSKSQTWYFDWRSRTIKSRVDNLSWDVQSAGRSKNMQVWNTNSGWW
jgi:hypothetical protein